ncbi:DUF1841 family protein [Duganella sp. FT50W]|uniref:DUF1841 family protein n=1 Tax=Duganella lactea TaxID=2692173 RepID=A0A6L8MP04_9BURK|nr:DUF1841 family protein [Duganella lactea]MYM33939.1 DUF1841 family protein [Duganella lactea]MYM84051.1 DUF1841 family protein [Duganella lactea]
MFNPSSDDVRRFFCEAYRKQQARAPLTPIEAMAADWIGHHPEYHAVLGDVETALTRDYQVDGAQANPFLHLSMHLSIDEQISIDQPPGIRALATELTLKLDDAHAAQHEIMECLGEMIWNAQRNGTPPDGVAYIEAIKRRL